MKIIGIYRELATAGKPEQDIAIANKVADNLTLLGFDVSMETVDTFNEDMLNGCSAVFSMARSDKILSILEKSKLPIINDPAAIRKVLHRQTLYRELIKNEIPIPETKEIKINDASFEYPSVIKNPEAHGQDKHIVKALNEDEFIAGIEHFKDMGLTSVLIQKFIGGRWIKFYGVRDKIYLYDSPETSAEKLKKIAINAAKVVNLDVYGGDIIQGLDNNFYLIDLNDWPTFNPVKEEAASEIAKIIKSKIKN